MSLVAVLAALAATAAAVVVTTDTPEKQAARAADLTDGLPAVDPLAPAPALGLEIPEPKPLDRREAVAIWAPVELPVAVRSAPSAGAPTVGRLPATTPEGTTNIAHVTGPSRVDDGLWVPIRAADLAGWVPRNALGGYQPVDTRLHVDTRALKATLRRTGKVVFEAAVGIGTPAAPTPTGEYFVRNVLTRYASPMYGPVAFGTTARSPTLTDWPAGGFVGIHGTDRPELLPGRVSHGCIRLRNEDILELARLMPVGTPVTIT